MTGGHIALIAVGVVGLAESTWGLSSPEKLREAVRKAAEEAPRQNVWLGLFFASAAALLWYLMSPDRQPSDWALLLISWVLAGGALVNFKPGGFHQMVGLLVLRRSATAIRAIYLAELLLACALIWLGVSGR